MFIASDSQGSVLKVKATRSEPAPIASSVTFQPTCIYSANMSCQTFTDTKCNQSTVSQRWEDFKKHFPIRQIRFHPAQSQVSKKSKPSHCLYMLSSDTAVQMFSLAGELICLSFSQADISADAWLHTASMVWWRT